MGIFRVKICGVTELSDARRVATAGADAVGLNLVPSSPRHITLAQARKLASDGGDVTRVAVVADAAAAEIATWDDSAAFDLFQFHGSESPADIPPLSVPYLRTIRLGEMSLDQVLAYTDRWMELPNAPAGFLVDAWSATDLGGTGQTTDWDLAAKLVHELAPTPIILAGGLTPQNVGQAIAHVRPAGVDTASGVESSPGNKDPVLVDQFVREARQAFENL